MREVVNHPPPVGSMKFIRQKHDNFDDEKRMQAGQPCSY
jgi:hypothetical protein